MSMRIDAGYFFDVKAVWDLNPTLIDAVLVDPKEDIIEHYQRGRHRFFFSAVMSVVMFHRHHL
jgi:hypothetical protein